MADGLGAITSLSLTLPFRHHASPGPFYKSTTIPVIIILMMVNGDDLAHLEGGRVERGLGLVVAARGGEAALQQELDHLNIFDSAFKD